MAATAPKPTRPKASCATASTAAQATANTAMPKMSAPLRDDLRGTYDASERIAASLPNESRATPPAVRSSLPSPMLPPFPHIAKPNSAPGICVTSYTATPTMQQRSANPPASRHAAVPSI